MERETHLVEGTAEMVQVTTDLVRRLGVQTMEVFWSPKPEHVGAALAAALTGGEVTPLPAEQCVWTVRAIFPAGHAIEGTGTTGGLPPWNHEESVQMACMDLLNKLGIPVTTVTIPGEPTPTAGGA